MKTRKTQLDIPDTPKYWRETLGGREYDFRAPFPLDTMDLLEELEANGVMGMMTGVAKKKAKKGPVTVTAKERRQILIYAGAALGLCWYDREKSLDTDEGDHQTDDGVDYAAYGSAVLKELYDHDFDPMELFSVMPKLLTRFLGAGNADAVKKRRDFSASPSALAN